MLLTKKRLFKALKIITTGAIIFFFALTIQKIGFSSIRKEIRSIPLSTVIIAAAIYQLSFIINNFRWYLLIKKKERRNFFIQFPVYMVGVFGNVITPGARVGGEVIKVFYMRKIFGGTKTEHFSYILLDKLGNGATFVLILFFTFLYVIGLLLNYYISAVIFIITVAAIIFFIYYFRNYKSEKNKRSKFLFMIYNIPFLSVLRKIFSDQEAFKEYIFERVATTFLPFRNIGKRSLLVIIILSSLSWGMICYSNWIIYRVFIPNIAYISIFVIVTISTLIGDISFTPGGLGFMETVMIMLSVSFGVDQKYASTAVIINRGIFYLITMGVSSLLSIPLIAIYGRRKSKDVSLKAEF